MQEGSFSFGVSDTTTASVPAGVGTISGRHAVAIGSARETLMCGRGLYLILTSPVIPHVQLAAAACERGVPALQLREKEMPGLELVELAMRIADVTRGTGTLLIINDRLDIALASGADGVHLGRSDASIETARDVLGRDTLVGLSTRTPDEAEAARVAGADYIGVGPVFPTGTKPDALAPIGLAGLQAVAARVPNLPKVAIGGITCSSAAEVLDAGAQYVAVISAVCHAEDPVAALDAFQSQIGPRTRPPTEKAGRA
jgi:thiamine-phosphate pyrophosphorylase